MDSPAFYYLLLEAQPRRLLHYTLHDNPSRRPWNGAPLLCFLMNTLNRFNDPRKVFKNVRETMKWIFRSCSVIFTLYVLFHLPWSPIYEFGVIIPTFTGSPWGWETNFVSVGPQNSEMHTYIFLTLNPICHYIETWVMPHGQATFLYFTLII